MSGRVEYYDVLANTVGGGKPKMRYHFDNNGWPSFFGGSKVPTTDEEKTKMVDSLQDMKTEFYKDIVESQAQARPGVLRLIDEAIAAPDIAVGICSAATKEGFLKVVNSIVGPDRLVQARRRHGGRRRHQEEARSPHLQPRQRKKSAYRRQSASSSRIRSWASARRWARTCRASSPRALPPTSRTSGRTVPGR